MMTLNAAIQILLHHTKRDCMGAGCGIRSLPSEMEQGQIVCAIQRVWPRLYGFKLSDEEARRELHK